MGAGEDRRRRSSAGRAVQAKLSWVPTLLGLALASFFLLAQPMGGCHQLRLTDGVQRGSGTHPGSPFVPKAVSGLDTRAGVFSGS